jgi:hypothetical protein
VAGRKVAKKAKKQKSKSERRPSIKSTKKEICFVIMPFGGWLDDYYTSIYCPAIEAAGLEPHRADDLFTPSTITNDIWAYTKRAKVLLADLTGKNPNVFYELGLAHALTKPAILISESLDDIPFDLRALRVILYDKNAPAWGEILKEKIERSVVEVLKAPVEAILPTFLDVKSAGNKPAVSAQRKDILEIKQEVDAVRRQLSLENRSPIRRDIGAEAARSVIKALLDSGMTTRFIVREVEPLGPPETWIRNVISEIKRGNISPIDVPDLPTGTDPVSEK